MIEKEGVILSTLDFKERDLLVYFATEQEVQTIYARGVRSAASKNRRLCNPFSRVRLTLDHKEGREMDILIRGDLLEYYYEIQEDLVGQSVGFVLRDCISRVRMNPRIYLYLLSCWQSYQKKENRAYTFACLCMAEILKSEGIEPYVQGCVRCHSKKKIETVSLSDGGFLCSDCNHGKQSWSRDDLKKFRGLFIVDSELIEAFCTVYSYSLSDFIYLAKWFERYEHVDLASLQFLRSIRTL